MCVIHPAKPLWGLAVGLLLSAEALPAQELHLLPGVLEVADESLPDVAMAAVDQPEAIIYYNPRLFHRYGPLLSEFFLAHEYGHLYHHHTLVRPTAEPEAAKNAALREQELEADCYAARVLGERNRPAVDAAIRFFTRLGPFRFDEVHPTGSQRSARLLACLPNQGMANASRPNGDTGVETGPIGGDPERITFRVEVPGLGAGGYGREVRLWIDGQPVGQISGGAAPIALEISQFTAGMHSYRMSLELSGLDGMVPTEPPEGVTGMGHIAVKDGDRFSVEWTPGEKPRLAKE